MRNKNKIAVRKSEANKTLKNPRRRCTNKIKGNSEMKHEVVDWIDLAWDNIQLMSLVVSMEDENFFVHP
jgi:IS30 family transposase